MQNPKIIPVPFANSGMKDNIPKVKSTSMSDEKASWETGFPEATMLPVYAGGLPPDGKDFNGVLNQISENIVFQSKGGRYKFDPDFALSIGGYPKGATLQTNDESAEYQSLIDNNLVNFNTATPEEIAQTWRITGLGDAAEVLNGKFDKASVKNELGLSQTEVVSQKVVTEMGSGVVGSFENGLNFINALTNSDQLVTLENEFGKQTYCWTGKFPKQVPAGSTPQSTGGIGKGAWASVGGAGLRGDLNRNTGAELVKTKSGESVQDIIDQSQVDSNFSNSLFPQSIQSFSNNRMAIEVVDGNPALGSGYINTYRKTKNGWWTRERIVTGQYSGGDSLPDNNCPVWRLGQLFICAHLLTLKNTTSSKGGDVGVIKIKPNQFTEGDFIQDVDFYQLQTAGSFVEFTTKTKDKEIGILFAASTRTENPLNIKIYSGSTVLSSEKIVGVAGAPGVLETFVSNIRNPRPGSEIKVRIYSNSVDWSYVAGINANFDTTVSDDIDKLYWSIFNTSSDKVIRPTQTGAMCYVFREESTGLFGGESHGGEVPSLQQFIVDNRERVLKSGEMFSCESFRVVQETQIKWNETTKIDCFTEHRFNSDGTHEFTGSFVPTENFKASLAYCPMFTVGYEYFKKITMPEFYNLSKYPAGSMIEFQYPVNSYEMQSSDNLYTAGIVWGVSLKNTDVSNVLIKPYTDSSTKFYAGPSTGKVINLEKFTIHQMRYYF